MHLKAPILAFFQLSASALAIVLEDGPNLTTASPQKEAYLTDQTILNNPNYIQLNKVHDAYAFFLFLLFQANTQSAF